MGKVERRNGMTKTMGHKSGVVLAVLVMAAWLGAGWVYAQDPQLPFSWKGDGAAWLMGKEGVKEVVFQIQLKIDEDGTTTGKFFNEDGEASIERMFFESEVDGARKVYLLLSIEDDDTKRMVLMNLRVLKGTLVYGEIMMHKYEEGGELEKGLGWGNKVAQEIYPDYLPSSLGKALKLFHPVGVMKATGGLSSE